MLNAKHSVSKGFGIAMRIRMVRHRAPAVQTLLNPQLIGEANRCSCTVDFGIPKFIPNWSWFILIHYKGIGTCINKASCGVLLELYLWHCLFSCSPKRLLTDLSLAFIHHEFGIITCLNLCRFFGFLLVGMLFLLRCVPADATPAGILGMGWGSTLIIVTPPAIEELQLLLLTTPPPPWSPLFVGVANNCQIHYPTHFS